MCSVLCIPIPTVYKIVLQSKRAASRLWEASSCCAPAQVRIQRDKPNSHKVSKQRIGKSAIT